MNSKNQFSKTERKEIRRLLENFILSDPDIRLDARIYDIREECTKEINKLFIEKMNITPEIQKWIESFGFNDTNTVSYNMYAPGLDHAYNNNDKFFSFERVDDYNTDRTVYSVYLTSHFYVLHSKFTDLFRNEIVKTFEKVYDKHYKDFCQAREKYNKILKEMIIVFDSCKNANQALEKFGFIDSINKYINKLLLENVKPISLCTKSVENSVDNYIKARKALDEEEK
jgi:hypothetical protein